MRDLNTHTAKNGYSNRRRARKRPDRYRRRSAGLIPEWRQSAVRTASRQRFRVRGRVAEADEHLAIVVDDVVDGQVDQAGVRRYSDDHHIVHKLGGPRRQTGSQHA
jgi:hypothetical protein